MTERTQFITAQTLISDCVAYEWLSPDRFRTNPNIGFALGSYRASKYLSVLGAPPLNLYVIPATGSVEKPMEPVAAGLDSDEVGIVTCRTATTWRCAHFVEDVFFVCCVTFSTLPTAGIQERFGPWVLCLPRDLVRHDSVTVLGPPRRVHIHAQRKTKK